jgi:ribosomal protein S4
MENGTISAEVEQKVKARLQHFKDVSGHIYVDGNTVDKAVFVLSEIESIEEGLDSLTGKSGFYKKYKEASEKIKAIFELGEEARKLIRQKIYGYLINGGEHDKAKLRAAKNPEIIVQDLSLVPKEYLAVDEDKIKAEFKRMDGNVTIPGIFVKARQELVVKLK